MPSRNRLGISLTGRRLSNGRLLVFIASLLAVFCLIEISAFQFLHLTSVKASSTNVSVTFPVSHPAILKQSRIDGNADEQQRISLAIGLRLQNQAGLKQYVEDINRPGSVNYHRYLTSAQYEAEFSPSQETYNTVIGYLQQDGFTITHTYTNHLLIAFSGTVGQVNHAFSVTLKSYVAPNGTSFYANDRDPQLPTWLASQIQSLTGLNNAVRFHQPPLKELSRTQDIHEPSTVTCPGHDSQGRYLTPDQTATAYNINGFYNAGYHGEGQSVALFELDTFVPSDLTTYASCYGHSHTTIQTVTTGSSAVPSDSGIVEVELDAQLILSAAPQLGRLVIYESGNDEADRLAQWAQIVQDAVPVVSTSWGDCELNMDSSEVQQENTLFMVAVAQGQSIFVASGDSGSAGCAFDTTTDGSQPFQGVSAGDPSSQPYVTSVGGTTLSINSSTSAYNGEVTWNNEPSGNYSGGASGGGISQYWTSPSWQSAPGVNNSDSSGAPCSAPSGSICRETPDVSLQADPNNGYLLYCSAAVAGCDPTLPWNSIGGTSAAAPMWAAVMAMVNQMSMRQGGYNIGFVDPLLYQLASNSIQYANSFHDITVNNNDYDNLNGGKYPALSNYDMATGLGSYNAYSLANNLISLAQNQRSARTSPANTTWYFAEGSVGNSFQEYLTIQNPSVSQSATVNITYLFEGKSSVVVTHTIPASTRSTVSVNQDLNVQPTAAQEAVSAIVQVVNAGPPIVVERPMYFSYHGINSGTDVMGVTNPQNTYYFPSIDSRNVGHTYISYITMLNPSSTQTANVTVTYYTGSCGQSNQSACPTQTVQVLPLHRGTATPLALQLYQQVSASVQSDQPIVVERPTYFSDTLAAGGGATTGAMSVVGASQAGTDWLFAEGYTGTKFQEFLTLANFSTTATSATITLEYDNGHRQSLIVNVPALDHIYFNVNSANATPTGTCDISPCVTSPASSAEVTSSSSIVVDRLMYFHQGSAKLSGGTETVGEQGPAAHSVYAFAEGYTAGSFNEFLTIQNPTSTDETVVITLFVDTYVLQEQVIVAKQSRKTININAMVVPIVQTNINLGSNSYAVSLTAQALGSGSKIVVERPMYFNFHGDPGGTDVLGYTQGS